MTDDSSNKCKFAGDVKRNIERLPWELLSTLTIKFTYSVQQLMQ